jgi:pSer/pThr/pTyr-binding forkhead associated (FHA) protein/S1-C subfamily serine protease
VTARLRLRDQRDGRVLTFDIPIVRIGRAQASDLVVSGAGADVVSGAHVRLLMQDGVWHVEDVGARNGTFLDDRQLTPNEPVALRSGQTIGLGERGPRFVVLLEDADPGATVVEARAPAFAAPDEATLPLTPVGSAPAPQPPAATVVLHHRASGRRFQASGGRLRVGRGRECELRVPETEQAVSRVHCEVVLRPDGQVVLRDAQSRNGTWHNGERASGDRPLHQGDRIKLGDKGPEFTVERLESSASGAAESAVPPAAVPTKRQPPAPAPEPTARGSADQPARAAARRSFGGKGRTLFVQDLISQSEKKHASRVRGVVWTFVVLLVGGVGGVYWFLDRRSRETDAELAAQREALQTAMAGSDSVRAAAAAEYQRLANALDSARAESAPAAVVDSLRVALDEARTRTASLEEALGRAREGLTRQLTAAESLRQATQRETERLRAELEASRASGISAEQLDSLRQAVQAAEARAATLEAGVRAVRGADLARIAQGNQAAVGLVSAYAGADIFDGSGFTITASGYFVTNRHVVEPEGRRADSVHVTMADQRTGYRSVVVAVEPAPGPDLALLKLPRYVGPYVSRVDWDGTRAQQGEPAALIGFPAGVAAALDNTRTVRTSMSAGIFSKVTPDRIQFDGFTVGGSSGSPIFNANGEVVAVHHAGLVEAAGLGFGVPVSHVLRLLPEDARRELKR